MDQNEIEFEAHDPRGLKVICYKRTWRSHIIRKRPIMDSKDYIELIINTITEPLGFIYQDSSYTSRQIYYQRNNLNGYYIKVVVEFIDKEPGLIITATPVNNQKAGERIVWP